MRTTEPTRATNWEQRLARWVRTQRGRPFEWGETDCVSLVRGAVAIVRGETPWRLAGGASRAEGWYTTVRGAREAYAATGGVERVLCDDIGAAPVGHAYVTTGDIVASDPKDDEPWGAVGVVLDIRVLSSDPERGVTLDPWHALKEIFPRAYRLPA